jgi:hypothetical protein
MDPLEVLTVELLGISTDRGPDSVAHDCGGADRMSEMDGASYSVGVGIDEPAEEVEGGGFPLTVFCVFCGGRMCRAENRDEAACRAYSPNPSGP